MRPTIIATAVIAVLLVVPTTRVSAAAPASGVSIASFEGGYLDLRNGWGEATACTSDGATTECFRTEKELDRYLIDAASPDPTQTLAISIQAVCSTTLRLYANTSFGGTVLALSTRGTFVNLSAFSFDNVTSSYRVGACSSTFYDGANGGAPTYPGSTVAGASAASMLAGWDNRISSVYIS
jgi:hypothetical protein